MKEFLAAGAVTAALMLFDGSPAEPDVPVPASVHSSDEGFIPHQSVTVLPVQENAEAFLPDFGSHSYL